jgi:hypothetical protein
MIALGVLFAGSSARAQTPPAEQQPPPQQPPPQQPAPEPAPEQLPPQQPAPQPSERPLSEMPAQEQSAPPADKDSAVFEAYGFVMLDGGYDFGEVGDPNWFDTVRPTKLPAFEDQFGKGGRTFAGVRQTRFGVRATKPTEWGDAEGKFEWELFGVGIDEGQTTFRLRHAYVDWWQLRAGQTWSPFMDIDVFPNSLEYWGPNGMPFFRNVQLAWMPIRGDSRVTVALERPGASADTDRYADRIELENVVPRFPAPDLSAEARFAQPWGYIEGAGIVRYLKWDDLDPTAPDLDGHEWGWGFTLSSNLKLGPALLKLQGTYGEAIENYMNDAPPDIAASLPAGGTIEGEALPVLGLVAFADFEWSKQFTSTVGWSFMWIDNSDGQLGDAFHMGHYALANLEFHPIEQLMLGGEFQFGRRENNNGGDSNDYRIQLSVRYNFSKTFGGGQ